MAGAKFRAARLYACSDPVFYNAVTNPLALYPYIKASGWDSALRQHPFGDPAVPSAYDLASSRDTWIWWPGQYPAGSEVLIGTYPVDQGGGPVKCTPLCVSDIQLLINQTPDFIPAMADLAAYSRASGRTLNLYMGGYAFLQPLVAPITIDQKIEGVARTLLGAGFSRICCDAATAPDQSSGRTNSTSFLYTVNRLSVRGAAGVESFWKPSPGNAPMHNGEFHALTLYADFLATLGVPGNYSPAFTPPHPEWFAVATTLESAPVRQALWDNGNALVTPVVDPAGIVT